MNNSNNSCGGDDSEPPRTYSKTMDVGSAELQDQETGEDHCGCEEGSRLQRTESSDSHFVLMKTRRNSGFGSKDPLFQGVYLHEGKMTNEQTKTYKSKFWNRDIGNEENQDNQSRSERTQSPERYPVPWGVSLMNVFRQRNSSHAPQTL